MDNKYDFKSQFCDSTYHSQIAVRMVVVHSVYLFGWLDLEVIYSIGYLLYWLGAIILGLFSRFFPGYYSIIRLGAIYCIG